MVNITLFIVLISLFIFGFHIMKQVDLFIFENKTGLNKYRKKKEPSYLVLPGNLSLLEIDREIDEFRKKHRNFKIILRDEGSEEKGALDTYNNDDK
ncbi:MAG: hypothetical protein K5931_03475 [Lachnospiraceae bacterium]|nr:hypothetical protein [Lachnospiraceae bacterium]